MAVSIPRIAVVARNNFELLELRTMGWALNRIVVPELRSSGLVRNNSVLGLRTIGWVLSRIAGLELRNFDLGRSNFAVLEHRSSDLAPNSFVAPELRRRV